MIKKIVQDTVKDVQNKVKNVSKDDIKNGAKEFTGAIVGEGIEVAKTGLFGILNGIIMKIIFVVTFIVIVLSVGCVGTNVAIDKLTSTSDTERVEKSGSNVN